MIFLDELKVIKVIISEQINMNLSNDSGKVFFLCSFVLFFYCILNIVQIALITLEVAIEGREIL